MRYEGMPYDPFSEPGYRPETKPTTEFVYPPIPDRSCDWVAYYEAEGARGWGRTEAEALDALAESEDRAELEQTAADEAERERLRAEWQREWAAMTPEQKAEYLSSIPF